MKLLYSILVFLIFVQFSVLAQNTFYQISLKKVGGGKINANQSMAVTLKDGKQFKTDKNGLIKIPYINQEPFDIAIYAESFKVKYINLSPIDTIDILEVKLANIEVVLDEVQIVDSSLNVFGVTKLKGIEGTSIYEGKKTEVLVMDNIVSNKSTNNARQVFARIAGINIWESDCAGLQLGVAARGLSPNRTANFNTRQNGYDMSADALGYPESYYSPPLQALDRIEVVRGAASLQYGTQFGGMLNFKMKEGPTDQKIQLTSEQSAGSFGFFNTFNSVGGTVKKLNYYAYYQYKRGDCWRPNSGFNLNNFYVALTYSFTEKSKLTFNYTNLNYLTQQAGGLLDIEFNKNPRTSKRERNWFTINWNLAAFVFDHKISNRSKLNVRLFGIYSNRQSVGNLERISVIDFGGNRTLIKGDFRNLGLETRYLTRYSIFNKTSALLVGMRAYLGNTHNRQGDGSAGSDANFNYQNPNDLENSDYQFPSNNLSIFAENIFNITDKLSLTPGFRFERISTSSNGYYKIFSRDLAGNILNVQKFDPSTPVLVRKIPLVGLGVSYKYKPALEFYGNFSQNYRSITFNDLRISNPNFKLDPQIKDESGFTTDIGFRGVYKNWLNYDFSLFFLEYNNRIGYSIIIDPNTFLEYRFQTNIGRSEHKGIEFFAEIDILKALSVESKHTIQIFNNFGYTNAIITKSNNKTLVGNKVELVPSILERLGLTYIYHKKLKTTLMGTYVSEQFTDATNSIKTSTAVSGLIPSYSVFDLSMSYQLKKITFGTSVNNIFNQMYFTRRADAYPGPGIIPSDGRGIYLSIKAIIGKK